MNQNSKQSNNPELPKDIWEKVVGDTLVRRTVTRENHLLFFHVYLSHYVTHETAPFQRELFAITEDESVKVAVIEAFRNSAKTTIMSLSYPIWAILGKQERKFVVLLAQTQQQARQYLANIKRELETNALLRKDLGPFEEPNDEWRSVSIVLPKYGARITVASIDQPIRGLRHGPYRPDLIICDDLEDLSSVRNRDTRNKLYDWLMGDIIPLGDLRTRLLVIGTRLHEDSLIMRLRKSIEEGRMRGITRAYPLINEHGTIAWPGKFPGMDAIEETKRRFGDERAWRREFLLEIVGDTDQVIDPSWIKYYKHLPTSEESYLYTITAIDLAISDSERADYTAMVTARVYRFGDDLHFFILPDPVNERLSYPDMLERAKLIFHNMHKSRGYLVVEDVAFQKAFIHDIAAAGINVISFRPGAMDKRTRLSLTAGKIKAGHILFPVKGAEQLTGQITHFGIERHDDLADAFAMLVIKAEENKAPRAQIFAL